MGEEGKGMGWGCDGRGKGGEGMRLMSTGCGG